jgi:hypothetical protein
MPIEERIARWYAHAMLHRIQLKRILIHPSDAAHAPAEYQGLPVVPMSI